jgi:DNA-binding SARP family transcriptional activator/class 3 adenylate cyclase/tetratricopeptide (TPR) repeat protein/regulation of enolase protein 1 (concanavalin A-like superfamily)
LTHNTHRTIITSDDLPQEGKMAHLTISLLGPYEVKLDGMPVTSFVSSKVRALLAYLAVEADHPHRRGTLAGLLWPDYPERSARTNLRNALSNLRTAIRDREAKPPYLRITREAVQFNEASDQQVDVRTLAGALEMEGADGSTIHRLEEAVALYRGSFLDGFSLDDSPAYDDWAYVVRERMARQVLAALQRLAAYHEGRDEYRRACEYAWRQVELEPWQEEAHRELMRLLALSGQRSVALAQYEACRRALREELEVEPGEDTTRLYERIRDGALVAQRQGEETRPQPPPHDRVLSSLSEIPTVPATPGRPLEGERRVATVLLAQVSGAADLLDELGTERWVEVITRAFQVLGSEVHRYGGEIEQYRSEGFIAFFGVTAAHEDDAERAVLAALAMRTALDQYAADTLGRIALKLDLSVTIHTGELIAPHVDSARRGREGTAMGRAIAVAERVEAVAKPGVVLVTERTHRLVRPLFEWESAGETAVPGADEPLALYRPLAHSGIEGKGRGLPGLASPLVGRQAELSALLEVVERLGAGVGGIITVVGEAGIGKSRLVAEARQLTTSHRPSAADTHQMLSIAQWTEGRCLSYATGVAYHLWLDMLHGLLGVLPDAPPTKVRDALQEWVRSLCPDDYDAVYPFLGRLLSLPLEEHLGAQLRGLGPEGLKAGTYRAVETLVESASQRGPLVLVCEDLHWTDRAPLLLLCVFRPETEHGCWAIREAAARHYRHRHTDLWLEPLSDVESRALVGNLLHVEELPETLRARILGRAEGNPFYVEEILRSLMESRMIRRDDATGRWVGTEDVDEFALPGTLHGVLMGRIDRLAGETKRVLQLASVIGRVFPRRVLAEVAQDGEELDEHLLTLQRGQMIRERARLLDVEYIFKHALTQEAAYNSLLSRERRRYHRRTAEALEQLYFGRIEEHVGWLAHHWEQAAQPAKAIPYLLRAGDQARLAYANEEAIGYYRRMLALLDDVPVDRDQNAWRLGALRGLGSMYHRTGKLSEAEQCFRGAIAQARETRLDPRERLRLYHSLGEVLYWQGRYDDRIRIGEEGLDLLGEDARSVEAALMLQTLAGAYWMKRDLDAFQELASRMAQFLESLPYEPGLRPAYLSVMDLYRHFKRNLEEATRWRRALERNAKRYHDLTALATAHSYAARFCAAQGDLHGAISRYRQASELFAKVGDAKESCLVQTELAGTSLRLGDLDAADAYICAARETTQESWKDTSADSHLDAGCMLLCRHDWEAAAEALQAGRQIFRELADPSAELRFTLLLSRTYLAQGNREEAQRYLQELGTLVVSGELDPDPFDLASVLGAAEEAFEGLETVRALHRRSRKEPQDHGSGGSSRDAVIQWFLESADARACGQVLCHDAFADVLSPGWTWQDPFEDCSLTVCNGLEIRAANGRGLAYLNRSAPRVLRPARGDWVVQTVCGPVHDAQLPDLGGLLAWMDEQTYLCLLKGIDGKRELSFWGCLDRSQLFIGRGRLAPGEASDRTEPVHLRLERVGERVRALCSVDGADWYAVGETAFPVADPVQVGLVAIGSLDRTIYLGAYTEGTAIRFESFDLWALAT